MRLARLNLCAGIGALMLAACGGGETTDANPKQVASDAGFASVTTERIKTASAGAEWLSYGGTYDEQRHSSLSSISSENVGDLGVAWTYDLATNRGVESTPIVVDGVMYVTSAWSIVYALDAKTGEELWVYDPEADPSASANACCDVVNRGVAVYDGKIFIGVIDGRLEALDARTGEVVWSTITVDQSKPYTITGAPRVVDGKVLIGNGGAELGVRGYVSAYDANSGEKIWRFYTAPNPNKQPDGEISDEIFETLANETWGDEGVWQTDGGGGTVWDSIVYDEVNDQILIGVGNGSPWNQRVRDPSLKDNLFLSSIVALEPDTGQYKWHFQTTPGDTWDYTATQTIILADIPIGEEGALRRVAMQAPKNGFFYVIDAETGEFISGEAFVPQNWTTGLDENGRPIETENARYEKEPHMQLPGPVGAHNWQPMAYNPTLGLAYIPALEQPFPYSNDPLLADKPTRWNTGVDFGGIALLDAPPALLKAARASLKGRLIAWDPVKQEARWSVEQPTTWNGGVLSTAGGLVFQGQLNGNFTAYDAATGEQLWSQNVKSGAASGPGTYEIDGEQYVTITTGWGSTFSLAAGYALDTDKAGNVGKVVTFKLGGTETIPDVDLPKLERKPQAEPFGDAETIQAGLVHYSRNCGFCHGGFAISSGVLPDLRWSAISGNSESWKSVVIDGSLASNGMGAFGDILTEEDAEAIRAYVLYRAHSETEETIGSQ